MNILILIGIFTLFVILLITFFIVWIFVEEKTRENKRAQELMSWTTERLEEIVYKYDPAYFSHLGEEKEPILEFRKLIESKDISGLHKKCISFMNAFVKLEYQAGYHGRPMLMEHYHDYELYVRELYKRKITKR